MPTAEISRKTSGGPVEHKAGRMKTPPFLITRASAGSGKTYTLVRRYLSLVLPDPYLYRRILAVTFTNKAANNMKSRILGSLLKLRDDKDPALAADLSAECELKPGAVRIQAGIALSMILHDYSHFSVGTIDSFNHRLVRQFAADLGLPGSFEVEFDEPGMLRIATGLLMDQVGQDEFVTEILLRFAEEKLSQESGWQVEREVRKIANVILDEETHRFSQRIPETDVKHLHSFIGNLAGNWKKYTSGMRSRGNTATDFISRSGLELEDFLGGTNSVAKSLFAGWEKKKTPAEFSNTFSGVRVQKALNEDAWSAKSSEKSNEIMDALDGGLRELAKDIRDFHEAEFRKAATSYVVHKNIHQFALLGKIESIAEDYQDAHSVIPVSGFNRRISEFISREPAEFIFWRMGEHYLHYLLDEFQDTSGLQWENFTPLFGNIRSGTDDAGSVLLVGDSKQAIYRWRNGKLELLENIAPEFFRQWGGQEAALVRNYRSDSGIVIFNNALFQEAPLFFPENALLGSIYSNAWQETSSMQRSKGYVNLRFIEKKDGEKIRMTLCGQTLEIIRECRTRNFQFRDIAILVRSSAEGSELASFLAENDIPLVSSDSLLIAKSSKVRLIIAVLRLITDSGDVISRHIAETHRVSQDDINTLTFHSGTVPLYELCEEMIRRFHLLDPPDSYLQHFLDCVFEFSSNNFLGINGFLEYWDDKKGNLSLTFPEEQDAVRVMTIHKAKGLEFPIVIIPIANWKLGSNPSSLIWGRTSALQSDLVSDFLLSNTQELQFTDFEGDYRSEKLRCQIDNMNILYVATTRACRELYIFTNQKSKTSRDGEDSEPSDISDMLNRAITRERFADLFREDKPGIFEMGEKSISNIDEQHQESVAVDMISESWRGRLRIGSRKRGNAALSAGILRNMKDCDELEFILTKMVNTGELTASQLPEWEAMFKDVFADAAIAGIFEKDATVRLSPEIMIPGGIVFRADRLIRRGEEYIAVTFVSSEAARKKAEQELTGFASAFREIHGKVVHFRVIDVRRLDEIPLHHP